jgi:ribosome maturation factor RimP
MIPKSLFERLINNFVYIYVSNSAREFGGKLISLTENDIIVLEDKNNNLVYIPRSEINAITERR